MEHCAVHSHFNMANINFIQCLHIALIYILTDKIWCNSWNYVFTTICTQICLLTKECECTGLFKLAAFILICQYSLPIHGVGVLLCEYVSHPPEIRTYFYGHKKKLQSVLTSINIVTMSHDIWRTFWSSPDCADRKIAKWVN